MTSSNAVARRPMEAVDKSTGEVIDLAARVQESLALKGDISGLTPREKVLYYGQLCERLGLDPYTQPLLPLTLNGKQILYAAKGATDQLARNHDLTREVKTREVVNDIYVVTARASKPDGRSDESIGAVPIGGLKGESLANAMMKAETKAKRRATLSLLGLGMLDESELETIPPRAMEPAGWTPADRESEIESAPPPERTEFHKNLLAIFTRDISLLPARYACTVEETEVPDLGRFIVQNWERLKDDGIFAQKVGAQFTEALKAAKKQERAAAKAAKTGKPSPEEAVKKLHARYFALMTEKHPRLAESERDRHVYQKEVVGKESTNDWTIGDYERAILGIEAGDAARFELPM